VLLPLLLRMQVVLTYVLDNGGVISYANLTITGTAVPPPLMDDSIAVLLGRPRFLRVLHNDVAGGTYLNISSFTGPSLANLGASIDLVEECPLLVTDRDVLNCLTYNPPTRMPKGQNFLLVRISTMRVQCLLLHRRFQSRRVTTSMMRCHQL
jgi:hypothetical protein